MADSPSLSVRKGDSESAINAVNQGLRSQPWYQQYLASIGQRPDAVKLSKAQSQQLLKLAQKNGYQVDEGNIEVDPAGNFNPKGHKLRNTLIAAGIGGAAALTGGAALGAFGGAGGAGAAGAAAMPALGGGSTLAAGLGSASALPAVAGGSSLAALGGGATLAGNLGSASALPSAGGGMGFWDTILGKTTADKVGTIANLGGNLLQSRQVNNAVNAQTDAANRALDLQGNIYQQQRADLAPYRGLGSGAAGMLAQGVGLPPAQDTTIPAFQQPQMAQRSPNGPQQPIPAANYTGQQAVPRSLGSLGGGGMDGLVNMVTPDGRPARVPQGMVQQAIAAGGKVAS